MTTAEEVLPRAVPRRPVPAAFARHRVLVLTAVCTSFYALISVSAYAQYLSAGYDLGIFDQAVRAYAHFQAPVSAVKAPGFDILGDHFHPILALLAPLYWVWDNPVMLLLAQAVLIGSSIPVVHRFAARRCGSGWTPLFIAGVYGLGWPLQAMANFDFHEVAFGVPILACAIDAIDRRSYRAAFAWSACLLLVKEDMGMVVLALAIYVAVVQGTPTPRWHLGRLTARRPSPAAALLALLGIVGFLVATLVVIPRLAPDGSFAYWQYSSLGNSPLKAAQTIVTRPWHAAWAFVTPDIKIFTLLALLVPLAFLPLRSPYVIVAVPLLAERFFNDRIQLWLTHEHYNALPWLVLCLAFTDALHTRRIVVKGRPHSRSWRRLVVFVVAAQLFFAYAVWIIEDGMQPGGGLWQRLTHWNNAAVMDRRAADADVPSNVCVEAENFLVPHLTQRAWVTLPGAPRTSPDYILLNLDKRYVGPSQTSVGKNGPKTSAVLAEALSDGFVQTAQHGPIIVLQSPKYRGPSRACRPTGPGRLAP